jgi:hypothetical protein
MDVRMGEEGSMYRSVLVLLAVVFSHPGLYESLVVAESPPEFAYRKMTLVVVDSDGKSVPNALVYGFSRDLNLLWPRCHRREDYEFRWRQSLLGSTGAKGVVEVVVPPGKWGFFAVARLPEKPNSVVAAWTDFRERKAGEEIRLMPAHTKRWELRSHAGTPLSAKQIFVKPAGFPIWIGAPVSAATGSLTMAIGDGELQFWATGDGTDRQPGFVLSWGTVSGQTADGALCAPGKPATIECRGGKGQAILRWSCREGFGLDGYIALPERTTVSMTPDIYSLGYRRPVASMLTGEFVAQCYTLKAETQTAMDFDTAITAGVDHYLWEGDRPNEAKLQVRLFLVDGNGHLMARLSDAVGRSADIDASVVLNGKRFAARREAKDDHEPVENESDVPGRRTRIERWEFMYTANVGSARSDKGAVWEFAGLSGVLREKSLVREKIVVTGKTFKMSVPKPLKRHAANILAQAETVARYMETVTGRKRTWPMTEILILPGIGRACADHRGKHIYFDTTFLFYDMPDVQHTFVHELAHNFGFRHSGLMELVVNITRCTGGDQITGQDTKWGFVNRMNNTQKRGGPATDTGLYLCYYALCGKPFLQFLVANEQIARPILSKKGFSDDEITAALCSLAAGRDMTPIYLARGLSVSPERIKLATQAARDLPLAK